MTSGSDYEPNPVPSGLEISNPGARASIKVDTNTSGDNTIQVGVAGKRIRVMAVSLIAAGAVSVKLKGGSTDIYGTQALGANGGFVLNLNPNQTPWCQTGSGEALVLNLSGAVQVGGVIVVEIA